MGREAQPEKNGRHLNFAGGHSMARVESLQKVAGGLYVEGGTVTVRLSAPPPMVDEGVGSVVALAMPATSWL
jgi:hypothetical protein